MFIQTIEKWQLYIVVRAAVNSTRTNRIRYNSDRKFNSKISQKLKVISNYTRKNCSKLCSLWYISRSLKRKIHLLLNKKKILFLILHRNFYFSIYVFYLCIFWLLFFSFTVVKIFCNQSVFHADGLYATNIPGWIIGHRNVHRDVVINTFVCSRKNLESQKSRFVNVALSR